MTVFSHVYDGVTSPSYQFPSLYSVLEDFMTGKVMPVKKPNEFILKIFNFINENLKHFCYL